MFQLDHVVPWGRSFDEYCRMFALIDSDLGRRIVGCGDGPAAFNADATRQGHRVVSCDPLYRFDAAQIDARIAVTYGQVLEQTRQHAGAFVWGDGVRTVEELGTVRMAAMRTFLADYEAGSRDGRYVDAELPSLPFADGAFDRVVVVDMLEHVTDDSAFVAELARITRPGGTLVVNTPHIKNSALRRLRHAIGLTDEKHGHLRPGYVATDLERLFAARFRLETHHTYSRFFSELIDTVINFAVERLGKRSSSKGMVVTGADVRKHRRLFLAYSLIYPVVWIVSRFDALVPASGYMLIARATRTDAR